MRTQRACCAAACCAFRLRMAQYILRRAARGLSGGLLPHLMVYEFHNVDTPVGGFLHVSIMIWEAGRFAPAHCAWRQVHRRRHA